MQQSHERLQEELQALQEELQTLRQRREEEEEEHGRQEREALALLTQQAERAEDSARQLAAKLQEKVCIHGYLRSRKQQCGGRTSNMSRRPTGLSVAFPACRLVSP